MTTKPETYRMTKTDRILAGHVLTPIHYFVDDWGVLTSTLYKDETTGEYIDDEQARISKWREGYCRRSSSGVTIL